MYPGHSPGRSQATRKGADSDSSLLGAPDLGLNLYKVAVLDHFPRFRHAFEAAKATESAHPIMRMTSARGGEVLSCRDRGTEMPEMSFGGSSRSETWLYARQQRPV